MQPLRRLAHRWRTRLPALTGLVVAALTVFLGAAWLASQPDEYTSNVSVLLIGAPTPEDLSLLTQTDVDAFSESPLSRLRNTTVIGDMYSRIYGSPERIAKLEAAGMRGQLAVSTRSTVSSPTPDHGPVVVFSITARSPEDVIHDLDLVVRDAANELAERQAQYDPRLTVTMQLVAPPAEPVPLRGSTARAAFGCLVLAAVLGVIAAGTVRAILDRDS